MGLDIFRLRDRVVGEYRAYAESFVHILDDRLDRFVRERLAQGRLWPEAVLQLSPAYAALGPTLGEFAAAGEVAPETARFFGRDLRLYDHQLRALEMPRLAARTSSPPARARARASPTCCRSSTRSSASRPRARRCARWSSTR